MWSVPTRERHTMTLLYILIELGGALGLFLYGMKIMSDGIQRAAGDGLRRALGLMTGTPFAALLTGVAITAIIQSSSATTVMVVSFVNAGLLSVVQAAGVIFGANIGTTVTAWIVSLIGLKISVAALALPAVGAGFLMMVTARNRKQIKHYGEALLGFGLLFLGLDFLSHAIPKPSAEVVHFIADLADMGIVSRLIALAVGLVLTVLVHSSSASTAIVITLALEGIIGFEMAAGMVLGCNIGTTIDALLASIGAKVNAQRAAWIHILFNVAGSLWAMILFEPFLALVNLVAGNSSVAQHIAMMHTVFNVINAVLFTPFTRQIAALVSRFIPDRPEDELATPALRYVAAPLMDSPELNLLRAQKEIADMAGLCGTMFSGWKGTLAGTDESLPAGLERFRTMEDYGDQMRDELSRFLLDCASHDLNAGRQADIGVMLRMVSSLEDITDGCMSLMTLSNKALERGIKFRQKEIDALAPYTGLVEDFLAFVRENIQGPITEEQLEHAGLLEARIDDFRSALRRKSRKRLQAGSDVRAELLYMDIVRHIERIGDHAWSVAHSLRDLH